MAAAIPRASEAAADARARYRARLWLWLLAGVTLLFWPTADSLGTLWLDAGNPSYTHGYLVLATCVALLWRTSGELAPVHATQVLRAVCLAALLVATFTWLFAFRAGILIATQLLLPLIAWLSLACVLGGRAARATVLPLGFLYFAVPAWDYLTAPLQWLTVQALRFMTGLAGIPAYFQGNTVQIPEGVFAVEGGCSGLHFLIV